MNAVKTNTMTMIERRGLSTRVIDSGCRDTIEYIKTSDVTMVFIKIGKVTIDVIKNVIGLMENDKDFVIIVYWNSLTPDAKNVISRLSCIQTFSADELMFDLIEIVPKHTLLSYKPKEYNKYPLLLPSDPVRKYYNFKKNEVVQVEEDDGTIQLRRCI